MLCLQEKLLYNVFNDVFNGININYGVGEVYKQLAEQEYPRVHRQNGFGCPQSYLSQGTHSLHLKIKVVPVISAIKKSHHNQVFKPMKKQSMKVQSIQMMNTIMKQDGMSSLQSIRKPTQEIDHIEDNNWNVCENTISICFEIKLP